jgi:uncharacterized protein YjbI with pentapeptide repeats
MGHVVHGRKMITAERAIVRPRVNLATGGELLLDEAVREFIDAEAAGPIALVGPAGSGKSTALRHLAATIPPGADLILIDADHAEGTEFSFPPGNRIAVYAAAKPEKIRHLAVYRLAPWGPDDVIEYLLARHRARCATVMQRIRPADRVTLEGVPELWAILLDELAADESLPDVRAALRRYIERQLPDTDVVRRAWNASLARLTVQRPKALESAPPGFPAELMRVMRHSAAQLLLAADRIVADLHGDGECDFLGCRLSRELVRAVVRVLPPAGREVERLRAFMAGPPWSHAMAASLLHGLGRGWTPQGPAVTRLAGAYLNRIVWPNATLPGADLDAADFSGADLSGAVLDGATARRACFRRARLANASLKRFRAIGANLKSAVLTSACAKGAVFRYADLSSADLSGAVLTRASLRRAKLASANCARANLRRADLREAHLEDADFTGANLGGANLRGLKLRLARWRDACFQQANLTHADLEDLDLGAAGFSHAVLTSALLTGTTLRGAKLFGTRLCEAGLGDIDWEDCCLRSADLTNASFHMGSSRSGLLFTTIASEGTRTGFYTDDYDERHFKSPEEIRKANLCGCDLRGALVGSTDFYLVDLRGAKYDPQQEQHFRRCGAILGPRKRT